MLGVGSLVVGIGLSTLPTIEFTGRSQQDVAAEVRQISEVGKLRARVENREGYLHDFAQLARGCMHVSLLVGRDYDWIRHTQSGPDPMETERRYPIGLTKS